MSVFVLAFTGAVVSKMLYNISIFQSVHNTLFKVSVYLLRTIKYFAFILRDNNISSKDNVLNGNAENVINV